MNEKDKVLERIIRHYLSSNDYNGLPMYSMEKYDIDILCQLIEENLIEVLSSDDVTNPHIKALDLDIDKAKQIEHLRSCAECCVLYPTSHALEAIDFDYSMPYSSLMRKGAQQFDIIYFDIEILERYANNPKFVIADSGYRGTIWPKEQYCEDDDIDYEYIRDYGMAYLDSQKLHRAIGVFVCDLAKLSSQKQQLWKGFELQNQDKCHVHPGFIKNLLLGEWVTEAWVFHAIIDEMIVINKMCAAMRIPPLFNHTYGTHFSEMPEGYHNILLPTKKNYYDFVLVLEKMLVHNISYKTFTATGIMVKPISRKDESGNDKGSLQMLSEWLCQNTTAPKDGIQATIVGPLRTIRKIRQVPAHELSTNDYDVDYYRKQLELVNDALIAIGSIRNLLSSHPYAKSVTIPDYLIDGTEIVNY